MVEQPRGNLYGSILKSLSRHFNFNFTTPWIKLDPEVRHILLYGTGNEKFKMEYHSERWNGTYSGSWEGAIPNLLRRYTQTKSSGIREWIEQFMSMSPCSKCHGASLNRESLGVRIGGIHIGELSAMSIMELQTFFKGLSITRM